MNRIGRLVGCIFLLLLGILFWFLIQAKNPQATDRPASLKHESYVWQRSWTEELSSSIEQTQQDLSGFTVLVAEIDFRNDKPTHKIVPINFEKMASISHPIGYAIRINPYGGPFGPKEAATQFILSTLRKVLSNSEQAGHFPAEIQIDYDCAESKLNGYRQWVNMVKREYPEVPVTITVLPSWINSGQFKKLISACDGYVIQVHSLEKPKSINEEIKLCDPDHARKWIQKAARNGIPFRVALPTYGYFVAYDEDGQFIGLSAEGPMPSWPEGARIKTVLSDAQEMADFVKVIQGNCPKNLTGFIWFRLPIESDTLNWRWHTLHRIIQGEPLRHRIEAHIEWSQPLLAEIYLVNSGDVDTADQFTVGLEVPGGCLAADGLMGYVVKKQEPDHLLFVPENILHSGLIRAQERIHIGWCRLEKKMEINAYVQTQE